MTIAAKEQIDQVLREAVEAREVPGVVALAASDRGVLYEGAFGVRVADSIAEKNGKGVITNAEGKTGEPQCWGRVSSWCDYSGPVQGETVGLAIFAGPENPLPSCWHARAYGLMAANPFGRAKSGFPDMKDKKDEKDLAHLDKGEHLKLRYGLFAHRGDVKQGKVAENFERLKQMK